MEKQQHQETQLRYLILNRSTIANSTYQQLEVQCPSVPNGYVRAELNEAFPLKRNKLCFVSSSLLADPPLFYFGRASSFLAP